MATPGFENAPRGGFCPDGGYSGSSPLTETFRGVDVLKSILDYTSRNAAPGWPEAAFEGKAGLATSLQIAVSRTLRLGNSRAPQALSAGALAIQP